MDAPVAETFIFGGFVLCEFDGLAFVADDASGYFNATEMCKLTPNKPYGDFARTKKFNDLSKLLGDVYGTAVCIPRHEPSRGVVPVAGTYCHPIMFLSVAMWSSHEIYVNAALVVKSFFGRSANRRALFGRLLRLEELARETSTTACYRRTETIKYAGIDFLVDQNKWLFNDIVWQRLNDYQDSSEHSCFYTRLTAILNGDPTVPADYSPSSGACVTCHPVLFLHMADKVSDEFYARASRIALKCYVVAASPTDDGGVIDLTTADTETPTDGRVVDLTTADPETPTDGRVVDRENDLAEGPTGGAFSAIHDGPSNAPFLDAASAGTSQAGHSRDETTASTVQTEPRQKFYRPENYGVFIPDMSDASCDCDDDAAAAFFEDQNPDELESERVRRLEDAENERLQIANRLQIEWQRKATEALRDKELLELSFEAVKREKNELMEKFERSKEENDRKQLQLEAERRAKVELTYGLRRKIDEKDAKINSLSEMVQNMKIKDEQVRKVHCKRALDYAQDNKVHRIDTILIVYMKSNSIHAFRRQMSTLLSAVHEKIDQIDSFAFWYVVDHAIQDFNALKDHLRVKYNGETQRIRIRPTDIDLNVECYEDNQTFEPVTIKCIDEEIRAFFNNTQFIRANVDVFRRLFLPVEQRAHIVVDEPSLPMLQDMYRFVNDEYDKLVAKIRHVKQAKRRGAAKRSRTQEVFVERAQ